MATGERGLGEAQRVVVKVGTRVLTQTSGDIALARLYGVVEALAGLRRAGKEVLLVTSGAVGLGRRALGLTSSPSDLAVRQACAAIGQSRLMALYQDGFAQLGIVCAQVLLTEDDFHDRKRYLSVRRTLRALLERGVVPIINENDVVGTEELAVHQDHGKPVFGDNDRLSALVASEIDCDLLVILTDVAGLFDKDPRAHADARLISRVDESTAPTVALADSSSGVGTGGMRTKFEAASIAARSGCHAVIASGIAPGALARAFAGENEGTWFPARGALSARRRWIAFAAKSAGALVVDAGAVRAIMERNGSVLAAGVVTVNGEFVRGDIVELRGPNGERVGRGIAEVPAETVRRWVLGVKPDGKSVVVRRDELVVEEA